MYIGGTKQDCPNVNLIFGVCQLFAIFLLDQAVLALREFLWL
jgi:hypothetical protein